MKRNHQLRKFALVFAAVALVALSGCNPAPKYARPPAPTPAAYKETAPNEFKEGTGWKLAEPGDDRIRPRWWEIYNDPQLNALEQQVQIANQSIRAAEANFRSARATVVSARASLFPTVGAAPAYSNSRFSSTSRGTRVVVPGSSSTSTTTSSGTSSTGTTTTASGTTTAVASNTNAAINNFTLPFDVSYTVDLWHRIRNTVAANAFSAEASAADVATALLSTQAELAQDYFQIRALDMEQAILQDSIANYRESLNLTTVLYRTGIDSEQDVSQAQTQLDAALAQATDLGVARAQFEHAIATLIGKPAAEFSLPVAPFEPNPPPVPVAVPSALLERRPDIAAAERRIAAANADIGVARAAYYPDLTLSASGGLQSSSVSQWFTWPSRFWSVGPTLSQTLFEGGARRALNEQAQAAYDAAVANYRQTVLSDFQAVEDNLSSLRILSQEVVQQQATIESAAHYLQLALTRYRTGVDSYLNVIVAQTSVLTNRQTQVQTQLRQMTASVGLVLALGGGWDPGQLPQMKDLLARPPKWSPGGEALPNARNAIAPANPPVVAPAPPPHSEPENSTNPPRNQ